MVVVQLLTNSAIIGKLLGDSIRVLACRKPWGKCSLRPNIRDASSISTAISSLPRPVLKQSMWPKSWKRFMRRKAARRLVKKPEALQKNSVLWSSKKQLKSGRRHRGNAYLLRLFGWTLDLHPHQQHHREIQSGNSSPRTGNWNLSGWEFCPDAGLAVCGENAKGRQTIYEYETFGGYIELFNCRFMLLSQRIAMIYKQ